MYPDYHVHSNLSFDCDQSPEPIVQRAIELGMKQICFTEHQDFNWPIKNENPTIDIDRYNEVISELRLKYNDKIQILKGVELGLALDNLSLCDTFLNKNTFDFVIGSIHIVDNNDPYYSDFWKNRSDIGAFKLYFETMKQCISSFNRINTLGHMDYIVRYSPNKNTNYSAIYYKDILSEILQLIIRNDICLEINTANMAKGMDFPNPNTDIIEMYKELGGRYVTVGSDAHIADNIGYRFDTIKDIIKKYDLEIYMV